MTATAVAVVRSDTKGAFVAPLFFMSLALAALGSRHGIVALWAGSALAMALAGISAARTAARWSWLMSCVVAYVALVVSSTLVLGPFYSPAGLYHPLLLLVAFLAVRRLGDRAERAAVVAVIAFAMILALWGAGEVGMQLESRARAFLETPATFAAVVNLALAPILAAILMGARGWPLVMLAMVLATGLFSADSRGGLAAMGAGCVVAVILANRAARPRLRSFLVALGILAAGWTGAHALRSVPSDTVPPAAPSAADRAASSMSRLELFALSFSAWKEQPALGTGYLSYRYTLEQGRARVPSYGAENETWFVHNDYLQTLQELGPAGLLAFAGFTLLAPILAYRRLRTLPANARPGIVVATSGLATMAVHALVDFPFYVPLCLLLYGVLLGTLDRRLQGASATQTDSTDASWHRIARAGIVTVAMIMLLRPVVAEAASARGLQALAAGHGQVAAFWLGVAQRVDAQDWRYHWQAGQFWDSQAAESGRPEAAKLAVDAYQAGLTANPLEVKSLLGLISAHRRHRALLAAPADETTLRAWAGQAAKLAPLHPGVRELASE